MLLDMFGTLAGAAAAAKAAKAAATGQSPKEKPQTVTSEAAKTLEAAGEVAGSLLKQGNLPQAARSLFQVADLVINGKASVLKLNEAVKQLDKDVPGTTKLVKEMAGLMKSLSDAIPQDAIDALPAGLRPLAEKTKDMIAKFDTFAKSYEDYQSSGTISRWWYVKDVKALTDWKAFKTSYDETEKEATKVVAEVKNKVGGLIKDPGKILTDPDVQDAARTGIRLGRELFKILDEATK